MPIDLNADLGESFGPWCMGNDEAMLQIITSANLACGFHAGDPLIMRNTLRAARQRQVRIGAHVSYPDLQGFGRRAMAIAEDELKALILYQIGALTALACAEGTQVTHVKPHGALNNVACQNPVVARTVAQAIKEAGHDLALLAPACSPLLRAGEAAGLRVIAEIFADRAYADDGQLLARSLPGAVLHSAAESLPHVRRMLDAKAIISNSGKHLPTRIDSICVHGDGADAVATASALRQALPDWNYQLTAFQAAGNATPVSSS